MSDAACCRKLSIVIVGMGIYVGDKDNSVTSNFRFSSKITAGNASIMIKGRTNIPLRFKDVSCADLL